MKDRTAREQVEGLAAELARVNKQLAELHAEFQSVKKAGDGLEELRQRYAEIDMEWQDWFEKFRNLYARINKRVSREKATEEETNGQAPGPISPAAQALLRQGRPA